MRFLFVTACWFSFLGVVPAAASPFDDSIQDSLSEATAGTISMVPGIEYEAGWLHRLFAGAHWRDLWTTEFEAEVLDLDCFAGGLTPVKKGGGLQTKNLRLKGNDGKEYKFRSMNKDGARALPRELQESVVADVYQDQISIGNPMAAVVVAPLLDAVGVLNATPRIVVMPDSKRLGAFRGEFANVLGMIEEHPKDGFGGADKIVDGFEIFEELRDDAEERIDQREYLKARLMDLLLGDRDRHADQLRWAGCKSGGSRIWRPIPRDRDFAFARYDGIFPSAAGLFAHSVVGFGESYPSILELTWIGRHLDRRFLNALEKPVWDSLTAFIAQKLTDSVILNALRMMPPPMYEKAGERMFRMLQARRNTLDEAANEFYELVSDVVDVHGSNKAERVTITRFNDVEVEVRIEKKKSGELLFNRVFSTKRTSEIRLYLLGGNDVATVEGNGSAGIRVRVIGGDGSDELSDVSKLGGTEFYDDHNSTTSSRNSKTQVTFDAENAEFDPAVPEPPYEDRYQIWRPLPLLGLNPDDGILIGGTVNITQFGFRIAPHAHAFDIKAIYAPRFGRYNLQLYAESYKLIENARTSLFFATSTLGLTDFFGLGNETRFDDDLADDDYYRTNYRSIRIEPTVSFNLSRSFGLEFTGAYEYADARVSTGSLLDAERPYGLGFRSLLAAGVGCTYDSRDHSLAPSKGIHVEAGGRFYPAVFRNASKFGNVHADSRVFIPMLNDVVLALHAAAEKTFGTYPFHHASMIGGTNTIRGYSRNRFAGDASIVAQSEIRVPLARVNVFVPGTLGITMFGDVGRVFLASESSKTWHNGVGGSVWLNVMNVFVANFSVARSPEEVRLYLTAGFGF